MVTALQIGLLLVLIALIGIILGYLFGKLSCKKQTNELYFKKNDYCESQYLASIENSSNVNDEKPSILSSENVATAAEKSVETFSNSKDKSTTVNSEAQGIVSQVVNDTPNSKDELLQVDKEENSKPNLLNSPRDNKADNLCRIKGIGFVIEEKLHNLGVFHFDQIAAWSEEEIAWVDSHLAFSGRIKREDWIGQAKKLMMGEDTEFSKRVDKGRVSTSKK